MPQPGFQIILLKALITSELSNINYQLNAKINDFFGEQQVGGRTAKVNFPEVPKGGERLVMGAKIRDNYRGFVDSAYKIYCGNLGWGVNSQGLREAFAEQPGILSAKVVYEKDSGRSRGFGFVSFTTAESAAAALDIMNGVVRTFLVHQFCNFKFIL